MERRHDNEDLTGHVLSKLIDLVTLSITQRDDVVCELNRLTAKIDILIGLSEGDSNDNLSTKVDQLIAQVVQNQEFIVGQFDNLTAKINKLQTESSEITAYIQGKGAEFDTLFAKNVELTTRIAELEPNQITQADRDALAANEAAIQAVIDGLNVFTPDVVVEPPPPVEEPPVEPPVEPVVDPNAGRFGR